MTSFGLVVPLFDEEERFPEFAGQLVDFVAGQPPGSELLFVDDGSRDGTADLARRLVAADPGGPVRLISRPHQGKGAAVAAGLLASSATVRGFCDLDLSTPLDQLEQILQTARNAPVLAIGSRDLSASRLVNPEGRVREALGRSYNRLLQATIAPGIVDTQCGAKVAGAEIWEAVLPHCREAGFAWDAEVIAVAGALGIWTQEVPIDWRHDERTKVRVGRDGLAMVWAVPRIWRRARDVSRTETATREDAARPVEGDRDRWWLRSQAAFVATALRRTMPGEGDRGWLVDVGAGAGGITSMLGWHPDRIAAVSGDQDLVGRARRTQGLPGVRGAAGSLPLADGSVEVVCLLDGIGHLDDPVTVLGEATRALAPGGRVVVCVPAHRWLGSTVEARDHLHRDDRTQLRRQMTAAGLEPVVLTHVFGWLVLPVWSRRVARAGRAGPGTGQTSFLLDRAAMVLTRIERAAIGRASLPLGTSLLCVAVRRGDELSRARSSGRGPGGG